MNWAHPRGTSSELRVRTLSDLPPALNAVLTERVVVLYQILLTPHDASGIGRRGREMTNQVD